MLPSKDATGLVRSILMPPWVLMADVLPARSAHVPEADRPAPSVLRVWLTVGATGPEPSGSVQFHVRVTLVLFHPAPLAAGVALSKAIPGAVLSMLMPPWVSLAVLPARSAHVPIADWSAPSAVRVWLTVGSTTPEPPGSVQLHVRVTLVLFQPWVLAGVALAKAMTGGVLSMLMPPTVVVLVLSALSVAVPLTDWLAPSIDSVVWSDAGEVPSATQLLMPEAPVPVSVQVNVTVTSELFQPAPFAGVREPMIVGLVASSFTVVLTDEEFPALSKMAWSKACVPSVVAWSVAGHGVAKSLVASEQL